jgi:hypothetical protein
MLDEWLDKHVYVAVVPDPKPWESEERMFDELALPLNLTGNERNMFYETLKMVRAHARQNARVLPIVSASEGSRKNLIA